MSEQRAARVGCARPCGAGLALGRPWFSPVGDGGSRLAVALSISRRWWITDGHHLLLKHGRHGDPWRVRAGRWVIASSTLHSTAKWRTRGVQASGTLGKIPTRTGQANAEIGDARWMQRRWVTRTDC